jgi:hypothetical protein
VDERRVKGRQEAGGLASVVLMFNLPPVMPEF